MSQGYDRFGGNPYGQGDSYQATANPYGSTGTNASQNPYGSTGASAGQNPYGSNYNEQLQPRNTLQHADSNYSQPSQYSQQGAGLFTGPNTNTSIPPTATSAPAPAPQEQPGREPLSRDAFLSRVDGTKSRITQLAGDIQSITRIHQHMLSSTGNSNSSNELESVVTQTQIRNTGIKDEIKFLERDAAREPNSMKTTQIANLKSSFKRQLEDFQKEEAAYSQRSREDIKRQYRVINPDATESEVDAAANADWGNEGVFSQALKTNRSGQASSVLGAVRARHNDIQRIEKTMAELALIFQQLNEAVAVQEHHVEAVEGQTAQVKDDTERANKELSDAEKHARRARKLKWYTLLVVVLIVLILALVLGLYFGLNKNKK